MRSTCLLVIMAVALAACGGTDDVEVGPGGELLVGTHRVSETETRGVTLGGRRLVLEGFAGSIHVVAAEAGRPAMVTFERVARGRTDLAARERLDDVIIAESGDGSAYTFRMTASHPEGAEVNVEAVVPRDVAIAIALGRGAVQVDSAAGDLDVALGSGPVRGRGLAGRRVRVATGSGAIAVDAGSLPAGVDWELETGAGAVALGLPAGASARLDAEAGTGTVRVEGLQFTHRRLDRRATGMRFSGTLGDGDGRIAASTEVGAVRLRAAGASEGP